MSRPSGLNVRYTFSFTDHPHGPFHSISVDLSPGMSERTKANDSSSYALSCRRPGILVLINDADWELEGEEAYEIQPGDNILFVSTLHGG